MTFITDRDTFAQIETQARDAFFAAIRTGGDQATARAAARAVWDANT